MNKKFAGVAAAIAMILYPMMGSADVLKLWEKSDGAFRYTWTRSPVVQNFPKTAQTRPAGKGENSKLSDFEFRLEAVDSKGGKQVIWTYRSEVPAFVDPPKILNCSIVVDRACIVFTEGRYAWGLALRRVEGKWVLDGGLSTSSGTGEGALGETALLREIEIRLVAERPPEIRVRDEAGLTAEFQMFRKSRPNIPGRLPKTVEFQSWERTTDDNSFAARAK